MRFHSLINCAPFRPPDWVLFDLRSSFLLGCIVPSLCKSVSHDDCALLHQLRISIRGTDEEELEYYRQGGKSFPRFSRKVNNNQEWASKPLWASLVWKEPLEDDSKGLTFSFRVHPPPNGHFYSSDLINFPMWPLHASKPQMCRPTSSPQQLNCELPRA